MSTLGLEFGLGKGSNVPSSPVIMPLRTVVTQNRVLSGKEARTNKDRQCFRWPYYIAVDCSELVISFNNWQLEGTGETTTGNAITIAGFSVEANSTYALGAFVGSASKTLANDDLDIQSDPILPSSFGLAKFTKGDLIWVRGIVSVVNRGTDKIPYSGVSQGDYTNTQCSWWDSTANSVSAIGATGVFTISGGSFDSRQNGYRPIVLGRPLVDGASFVVVGDSIAESSNDAMTDIATGQSMRIHGRGFVQRSTRSTGNDDFLPVLNMARSASSSDDVEAGTRVKQFFKYAKYGIDEYGENDMDTGLQTRLPVIWTAMRNAGCQKIIRTKYPPRVTTTDNYATTANQTPVATHWGLSQTVDTMNQWFDTKQSDGTIDIVQDPTSIRSSSDRTQTNYYKWIVDGTAQYGTTDGQHPSYRAHEFWAVQFRTVLRSI